MNLSHGSARKLDAQENLRDKEFKMRCFQSVISILSGFLAFIILTSCGPEGTTQALVDRTIEESADVISIKISFENRQSVVQVMDKISSAFKSSPPQVLRITNGGEVGKKTDKDMDFFFTIQFKVMTELEFTEKISAAFPNASIIYIHIERVD